MSGYFIVTLQNQMKVQNRRLQAAGQDCRHQRRQWTSRFHFQIRQAFQGILSILKMNHSFNMTN